MMNINFHKNFDPNYNNDNSITNPTDYINNVNFSKITNPLVFVGNTDIISKKENTSTAPAPITKEKGKRRRKK